MLDRLFNRDDSPQPSAHPEGTASVLAYGATRDGKTDDTDAFIAAIDAAGRADGVVHVPAGHYRIRFSDPSRKFTGIVLHEGCQLVGDGPDKTILQGLAESMDPAGKSFRLILVKGNTRLAGLTVDGDAEGLSQRNFRNKKRSTLVRSIPGSKAAVFEDLIIRNGYSRHMEGFGLSVGNSNDCIIRRVEAFGHIGGSGISVDGNVWKESRPTNTIIEDVVSHHNGWQGVTTYGALGVRVVRAKTHDNERHGLNSEWSDDVTFEDCETFANGRRGVRIAGRSRGVQLLNVRSYDNGADNPNGGEILIGMQVFPLANSETGEMVNGFPENVQVVDSELLPARGRPHIQMDAGTEDAAAIEPLKSRLNLESPGAKNWTIQAFDVAGASRGAANKRAADREVTPALAEDSALAEEQ